jgi:hypothetical protein
LDGRLLLVLANKKSTANALKTAQLWLAKSQAKTREEAMAEHIRTVELEAARLRDEAAEHEKVLLKARIKIAGIHQTEGMPRSLETVLGRVSACLGDEKSEEVELLARQLAETAPPSKPEFGATLWALRMGRSGGDRAEGTTV